VTQNTYITNELWKYILEDCHRWDKLIPFQGRQFFLNFLAIFLVTVFSALNFLAKNAFFYIFVSKKVMLPLCYAKTNNKVGTKRQNYCDNSQNYSTGQLKYALCSAKIERSAKIVPIW